MKEILKGSPLSSQAVAPQSFLQCPVLNWSHLLPSGKNIPLHNMKKGLLNRMSWLPRAHLKLCLYTSQNILYTNNHKGGQVSNSTQQVSTYTYYMSPGNNKTSSTHHFLQCKAKKITNFPMKQKLSSAARNYSTTCGPLYWITYIFDSSGISISSNHPNNLLSSSASETFPLDKAS